MPIKRLSFPTRNIAPANSHSVRAEELGATPVLPHWFIRRDDDAVISKILGDLDRFPQPDAAQAEQTRPPIGFAENVRHAVTKNAGTRLAYRLLYEHVSRDNPDHEQNVQRLLGLCSSELTKAIILFLAEKDADREFDETDLPFEMIELEPGHWTPQEKSNFEMDLSLMTVRASGLGATAADRAPTAPPSRNAGGRSYDHDLSRSHPLVVCDEVGQPSFGHSSLEDMSAIDSARSGGRAASRHQGAVGTALRPTFINSPEVGKAKKLTPAKPEGSPSSRVHYKWGEVTAFLITRP
jgi:hypothetical protein